MSLLQPSCDRKAKCTFLVLVQKTFWKKNPTNIKVNFRFHFQSVWMGISRFSQSIFDLQNCFGLISLKIVKETHMQVRYQK